MMIISAPRRRTFLDSVADRLGIQLAGRRTLAEMHSGVQHRYARMPSRLISKSQWGMADNPSYFRDHKPPFMVAAQTAITLAATDKLLWPGSLTALVANYFIAGKMLAISLYGTITTAATPGNLNVELYYGTTDAGGTLLASSAALTLVANQTTIPFLITAFCRCHSVGPTGKLLAWAQMEIGTAVIAAGQALIPASAPAEVTVDTTAASGFNVQFKRSGSTAETATTQDMALEALN